MKIVKILLSLILVLVVFGVVIVIYLVKFNNQTYPGSAIKKEFIKHPRLVNTIGLNEPGDYRYSYTSPEYSQLNVLLVSAEGIEPSYDAFTWIKEMINNTINKRTLIALARDNPTLEKSYSKEQLNQIREQIETDIKGDDLIIIYLTKYQEEPGLAGITLHRDTIFIFKQTLKELNENQELVDRLERSTIMHEWAHLLGVQHTDDEGCIMSKKINVHENPDSWKGFIPIEYCSSTIYEIKKL